jgi:hypothetical protein
MVIFNDVAKWNLLNSNLPLEISCNVIACFAKRKMFLYWGNKYVITGPIFISLVIAAKLDSIVQQSKSISANDSHNRNHNILIFQLIYKCP